MLRICAMWVSTEQRLYCLPKLTTGAQLFDNSLESNDVKPAIQVCDSLSLGVPKCEERSVLYHCNSLSWCDSACFAHYCLHL